MANSPGNVPHGHAPPDDERLYALVQQEAWLDALGWLHRAWRSLGGNARARRAARVFDEAFFENLGERPPEALEQRLLLHHGRMRALPEDALACLNDALARHSGGAPSVAARAATGPGDAETEGGTLQRDRVDLGDASDAPIRLTRVAPPGGVPDARTSLFKSPQERAFFEALRGVFPTHFVYPNAALNAVLDYERLRPRLGQAERDYFFRALVDAAVADPLDDLRPVYFFELDSAHHDAAPQRANDRLKDRIFAKAGQTLFRLRCTRGAAGSVAFARAVRVAVREK